MERADLSLQLKSVMTELNQRIQELNGFLLNATLLDSKVFELPRTLKEDENRPYEEISVVSYEGKRAISMATEFWTDFYAPMDGSKQYSTKIVPKMPGVLSIEVLSPSVVTRHIEKINLLKDDFHNLLKARYASAKGRSEFLRDYFQGLIPLQLYRHIQVIDQPVSSVTFSWTLHQQSEKTDKEKIINKLNALKLTEPPEDKDYNEVSWEERIDREIAHAQGLSESKEYRIRRKAKVLPNVNVLLKSTGKEESRNQLKIKKEANSPLIIINAGVPKLGSLADYVKTEHKGRASKRPSKLIFELGHLKVYETR